MLIPLFVFCYQQSTSAPVYNAYQNMQVPQYSTQFRALGVVGGVPINSQIPYVFVSSVYKFLSIMQSAASGY